MNGIGLVSPLAETNVKVFNSVMRMVYVWMALGLVVIIYLRRFMLWNMHVWFQYEFPLSISVLIAEIIMTSVLSVRMMKMSPITTLMMFLLYTVLNGLTFISIFTLFDDRFVFAAIQLAFFITAVAFLVMALASYIMQIDLSQYRTYFIMGAIGLVVAALINLFPEYFAYFLMKFHLDEFAPEVFYGDFSPFFDLLISIVSVVAFVALLAYNTQKIKQMVADSSMNSDDMMAAQVDAYGDMQQGAVISNRTMQPHENMAAQVNAHGDLQHGVVITSGMIQPHRNTASQVSIYVALRLYVDFVSLFLILPRLLGRNSRRY